MKMVEYLDQTVSAQPITEQPSSLTAMREVRPDLKRERHDSFSLREIRVSPVTMQELRERRIESHDLGWSVGGHRINAEG